MSIIVFQISSNSSVCLTAYSHQYQRKYQIPLCGESPSNQWIPSQMASNTEWKCNVLSHWLILCSAIQKKWTVLLFILLLCVFFSLCIFSSTTTLSFTADNTIVRKWSTFLWFLEFLACIQSNTIVIFLIKMWILQLQPITNVFKA